MYVWQGGVDTWLKRGSITFGQECLGSRDCYTSEAYNTSGCSTVHTSSLLARTEDQTQSPPCQGSARTQGYQMEDMVAKINIGVNL